MAAESSDKSPAKKAATLLAKEKPKAKRSRHPAIEAVWKRSYEESADFIQQHVATSMLFDTKLQLHDFSFREILPEGLLLEFGVFKAASLNRFATLLKRRGDKRTIYGFDAFSGLSEDWVGHAYTKLDRFDLNGELPEVKDNAKLVPGWVDDTLPGFLAEHPGSIAFLHLDTDTYAPAKTILELCRDRLVPGSVILFDELLGYPGWRAGEFKALMETIAEERYVYTGFCGCQALVKIVK